ncbi:MAG TPA: serine hydrolase domain-containing protein [Spirillospora sp.]|nr:serine hydrolase domain-containing protein [Spirillospora sp.]
MDTTVPEKVGLDSGRLKRLDALVHRYIDAGEVPGVLMLVARRGQVAYWKCFGMMDIEQQRPTQADTIYRIYSMTKPIVSVALLMLYEEGYFFLDEPVDAYIPEFRDLRVYIEGGEPQPLQRPITFHHLLTHTAGLTYDFLKTSPVDTLYEQANLRDRDVPLRDWIKKLAALPLVNQPGTVWRYSMATDVVGYLVEVLSGMPLDAFLQTRIFEPLGMIDTSFYVPPEKADRLATLYGSGLWVIGPEYAGDYTQPPRWLSGGGGLVSTAADYLRFCQMLLGGGALNGVRLLGRKTVAYMTTNHLRPDMPVVDHPGYGFGLGVDVLLDPVAAGRLASVGEFGWGGAAYTHFWIDPAEDLIAIKMSQIMHRDPEGVAVPFRDMHTELRTAVYQALVD